jgi:hypothetical protein
MFMGAKNAVIAGDYQGKGIGLVLGSPNIIMGMNPNNNILLDKFSIDTYDVITEDIRKSAASGVIRGAVGTALLGPVGLLAGLSAKNKGVYTIAVRFKDGKNSLMEVDEKIYKAIVKMCF